MAAQPAAMFEEELKIFYAEASQAARFLYAYLAIGVVAEDDQRVRQAIDEHALFWNTTLQSLQMSTFIVLGRIFDRNARHNIYLLLTLARRNSHIFSRNELRQRKAPVFGNDISGLDQYVAEASEPDNREFDRLERLVRLYAGVYDKVYREIRNRVFAHKVYATPAEVDAVFKQTNVVEVQRLVSFLTRFHNALWEALENGARLTLRRSRHSVVDMLASPKGKATIKPVSEDTAAVTKKVLQALI